MNYTYFYFPVDNTFTTADYFFGYNASDDNHRSRRSHNIAAFCAVSVFVRDMMSAPVTGMATQARKSIE